MIIELFYDHHIANLRGWKQYEIDTDDIKEACYQASLQMYPFIKERKNHYDIKHCKAYWAGEFHEWDSFQIYNDEPLPGDRFCPKWLRTDYWLAIKYRVKEK